MGTLNLNLPATIVLKAHLIPDGKYIDSAKIRQKFFKAAWLMEDGTLLLGLLAQELLCFLHLALLVVHNDCFAPAPRLQLVLLSFGCIVILGL